VKAAEQEAAKDFAYGCHVDRGLEELSCPSKDSIGNHAMIANTQLRVTVSVCVPKNEFVRLYPKSHKTLQ